MVRITEGGNCREAWRLDRRLQRYGNDRDFLALRPNVQGMSAVILENVRNRLVVILENVQNQLVVILENVRKQIVVILENVQYESETG